MSMRDVSLTNIETAIRNVDYRDKVLAALIVFRELDAEERDEVLRDALTDYHIYHRGTGTFVHGGDNIRLVSAHEWTCEGCLALVPDGAGDYVNDIRVCERCAEETQREGN